MTQTRPARSLLAFSNFKIGAGATPAVQYRRAFNPPAGNDDAVLVDLFDQRLGEDPDAKPLEPSCRLPRQGFRKAREDALGTV